MRTKFNSSLIRNCCILPEPGPIYSSEPGEEQHSTTAPTNSFKGLTQKRGKDMGKLNGKIAVITAATSGMALATARLFVEEGAYVFITGQRQTGMARNATAFGTLRIFVGISRRR